MLSAYFVTKKKYVYLSLKITFPTEEVCTNSSITFCHKIASTIWRSQSTKS